MAEWCSHYTFDYRYSFLLISRIRKPEYGNSFFLFLSFGFLSFYIEDGSFYLSPKTVLLDVANRLRFDLMSTFR